MVSDPQAVQRVRQRMNFGKETHTSSDIAPGHNHCNNELLELQSVEQTQHRTFAHISADRNIIAPDHNKTRRQLNNECLEWFDPLFSRVGIEHEKDSDDEASVHDLNHEGTEDDEDKKEDDVPTSFPNVSSTDPTPMK